MLPYRRPAWLLLAALPFTSAACAVEAHLGNSKFASSDLAAARQAEPGIDKDFSEYGLGP